MTIPDYQSLMLPLLKLAGENTEVSISAAVERLSEMFGLSEEDRQKLLPSGRQFTFENRVGWARTYMKKAGLLDYPRRAHLRITDRGREVLSTNPSRVDNRILKQFPEFLEFQSRDESDETASEGTDVPASATPEESIEHAYAQIRSSLASELIVKVKACTPSFFEQLVVDLLVAMGYGGSRRDAGRAVGRSGDGGIDGVINEDRLGLDIVYIQAKRWEGAVGRPEIQKFVGALSGHRARKGAFITTSTFTRDAEEYVSRIDTKIVLVNGEQLAGLMIENGIGVTPQAVYEVKRVDSDYFVEEWWG